MIPFGDQKLLAEFMGLNLRRAFLDHTTKITTSNQIHWANQ